MTIRQFLLLICIFTTANKFFGQQSNATLDETIEFIEGKLDLFESTPPAPMKLEVKFNKSTKVLKHKRTHLKTDFQKENYFYYEIPITKINPNNILIKEVNGVYWIYLYTNNNSKIISERFCYPGEDSNKIKPFMVSEISFRIPADAVIKDSDLPERLKNAFIHLIKLSGGTGEKF
jgi:hypothetical protein